MSNGDSVARQLALTAPVISKLPLGLLGLFGIKSGGMYPQSIAGQIAMTIGETMPWLACMHRATAFEIGVPVTAINWNPATTLTVPQTEVWYVEHADFTIFVDAAETFIGSGGVLCYQGHSFSVTDRSQAGPGAGQIHLPERNQPFWMGPGDQLGFEVDAIVAPPLATGGQIRISMLRMQL